MKRILNIACFLAILLSLGSTLAQATTIVIYRTDVSVVVGVDSLRTGSATPVLACKIRAMPNDDTAIMVASGYIADGPTGFDLFEMMDRAARIPGPLSSKAKAFEPIAIEGFKKMIADVRQKYPEHLDEYLRRPQVVVVFIGMEEGKAFVAKWEFRLSDQDGTTNVRVDRCESCSQDEYFLPLGYNTVALSRMSRGFDRTITPPDVIRQLIETEIAAEPNFVGPPINIIEVSKAGRKWIEQSKVCQ